MCKVTKESSGANKIMRNAIDFMSITLRWTSSSSRQSVFSTTSDGSQRLPNGDGSRSTVYLVKNVDYLLAEIVGSLFTARGRSE